MHIVLLASGYPSVYSSIHGIFFKDQAEALQMAGNDVGIIVLNPISIRSVIETKKLSFGRDKFIKNKIRTSTFKYLNIPKWYDYRIHKSLNKGIRLFDEYIAEFGKPEIIHVHSYQLGPMAIEIKKKYSIPFVVTEHSSCFQEAQIPAVMEKYARLTFEHSNLNIAVSNELTDFMSSMYQVPFRYVPNVVNTEDFTLSKKQESTGNLFTFFNAGSLVSQKNQALLLEAFKLLNEKYKNTKLKIAGSGILDLKLRKQSALLGIEDSVEFLGLIERTEIINEMQSMDAFVLSSSFETFGVVIIEALSCGKPVVSTNSSGPKSIIISDELGVLCEQNKKDLFLGMEFVFQNYATFNSVKIRNYAIKNFSNGAVASILINIYNEVLSSANS